MEQRQLLGHSPQGGGGVLQLRWVQLRPAAAAGQLLGTGSAGVPKLHGQRHVVQLLLQGGLLTGAVPAQVPGCRPSEGRHGAEPLQHPLQAGVLPQFQGQFPCLRLLHVHHRQIDDLPEGVNKFVRLKVPAVGRPGIGGHRRDGQLPPDQQFPAVAQEQVQRRPARQHMGGVGGHEGGGSAAPG